MSKHVDYELAKKIMGDNFIGLDELNCIKDMNLSLPKKIPVIPYSEDELRKKKEDYFLILAVDKMHNGKAITIRNMIDIFGRDPSIHEPCFYNQDWYEKEDFIDTPLKAGWFLIRKTVYESSRAVQPAELLQQYIFPSAVSCCYAFYVVWLSRDYKLWYHDFVWCRDIDHNGDRIYVGKYNDVDGVNKNGFSIHRHLGLRECYGCVDIL